jgi:uncharacterized protein (TIGR00255 family)
MEQTELTLRNTINSAIAAAQNITVKSNDDYEIAGSARKELKYTIKQIADYWGPKVQQAFQMHKTLVAAQKDMATPLEQADKIIDGKMMEYRREQERIRQEVVLYASRIDVDEELSRLNTHLAELRRVLAKGGAVGKRLDFLMQELHREANTLGSKSVDVDVSQTSMELKVLIEQMREQVQNIE